MASKKKNRKPSKNPPNHLKEAAETRSAMAATVAWSLSLMSTLSAEAIGFACQFYNRFAKPLDVLVVLGAVMLFVALVAGVVTLVLTPVVLRLAKQRPPTAVVQTAVIAGCLPLIVVLLQYFN